MSHHFYEARASKGDYHRLRWMRKLMAAGLQPGIILIEQVDESERFQREVFWIAFYRALGFDLVNSTSGGEGAPELSDESRRKMSDAAKRAAERQTPEQRALRGQNLRVLTTEQRKAASIKGGLKRRGVNLTPEHCAKIAQGKIGNKHFLGKRHSEETKQRCSLAKIGNTARLGQPHLESTKQKLREIRRRNGHPTFKLNWELVAEIRRRFTGERGQQSLLAREYGVSQGVISEIVNNKIWVLGAA
jgi:hypothetical protein